MTFGVVKLFSYRKTTDVQYPPGRWYEPMRWYEQI